MYAQQMSRISTVLYCIKLGILGIGLLLPSVMSLPLGGETRSEPYSSLPGEKKEKIAKASEVQ